MAQRGLAENAATVSVILPNYNHGHILHRAVEALLAQD
jgi:glycosyltransferase involved in cell wall biosynthesis